MEGPTVPSENEGVSSALEVRLLGSPELVVAGKAVVPRASDVSLLAYLLIHRNEAAQRRDAVAFLFWPDIPEEAARARLRSRLHSLLKRSLPASPIPWLISSARTVHWNPDAPLRLDVERFERLAADETTLADALDLYRGELLYGIDEQWLVEPRARFHDLYVKTLLRAATGCEYQGDIDSGIRYAKLALSDDPWNEEAVRILGRLWSAAGDRARAIQTYRDFVQRLNEDLGIAPGVETVALYERIGSGDGSSLVERMLRVEHVDPIPISLTPLYGREQEVENVGELLKSRRLVTLTGVGGAGKSRIAQEVARRVGTRFTGGVRNVEFDGLALPAMVFPHVAVSLGVAHSSGEPLVDVLVTSLGDQSVLILFENCEHLVRPIAELAQQLLSRCNVATILATSRESLRVASEWVEVVQPLPAPDSARAADPEGFYHEPAVRLFLDRAVEASPAFRAQTLDRGERDAIVEIVRRLDGIPLAIELAAARTNVLPPAALAKHLNERFSLLTSASRTAHPRQQTLRQCIDWSYDLLSDAERRVFTHCSVFAGSWTLEAAAIVCFEGRLPHVELVGLLSSLVEKSLMTLDWQAPTLRYHLFETLRTYANERLGSDTLTHFRRKHLHFFADLAKRYADAADAHGNANTALIRADWGDFMVALEWALFHGNDIDAGTDLVQSLRRLPDFEDNPELQVWKAHAPA